MSEVLHPWPYKKGAEFMTPDAVWSAYLHEHRMRRLWEIELAHCAKRIHNQRAEINRLAAEVEALRADAERRREKVRELIMRESGAGFANAATAQEVLHELVKLDAAIDAARAEPKKDNQP